MAFQKAVIGLAPSQLQASAMVSELQRAGFSSESISALFPEKQGAHDVVQVKNTKAPEGAITGVGAGGAAGATLGLMAGTVVSAIPGLGPIVAVGPMLGALSGAAAGAAIGGIAGALTGLGIPEFEAKQYEGKVKDGHVLLSVHTDNAEERERAKSILDQGGATDIVSTGEKRVPSRQKPSS